MKTIRRYPHGTFSWIDLSTTDQPAAREFYKRVFGWDSREAPMGGGATYTMFQVEGRDVAALSQMQPEQQEQGMPPYWNSYITVDDVEETTRRAEELGAAVIAPPMDVMGEGRMSIIQDPSGGVVALWQAQNHVGAQLVNQVGTLCWNELATWEAEKAATFYSDLFGWDVHQDDTGYYTFRRGERGGAGMMQMTEEWGEMPPHWMVYIAVGDLDATLERVRELDGQVINGPFDAGQVGRMAVIQDPQGAVLSVIEANILDPIPDEWTAEA